MLIYRNAMSSGLPKISIDMNVILDLSIGTRHVQSNLPKLAVGAAKTS